MAKQTINQGTAPFGDGGENIRVGTAKLQANDDELYAFLGAGVDGILNQAAARAAIGLGSVDNTSDVDKPISTATQNALNQKANTADVNTALEAKANTTEVNTALAGKADLVGGFIPTSQIPAIAITEFLGNVATEAAMLALVGQKGDWCIRTDLGKAYIITSTTPSLITDWTEWVYPVSPVTSVNGQVGVVTLNYTNVGADAAGSAATVQSNLDTHAGNLLNPHGVTKAQVGLGNVDNTSDANKPISTATQTALNAKANSTDVNTALSSKADLVDGHVPPSQLPINNTLTSTSTTEVLSAAQAKVLADRDFGFGQTETDVTASREFGVTYTNTTNRPIEIMVSATINTAGAFININSGGVFVGRSSAAYATGALVAASAKILPGKTYSFTLSAGAVTTKYITETR